MKISGPSKSDSSLKGFSFIILAFIGVLLVFTFIKKSQKESPTESIPSESIAAYQTDFNPNEEIPIDPKEVFKSTLPIVSDEKGYVGEARCKECHASEHRSWHDSYHRTMTQVVDQDSIKADFDNVSLEHGDEIFTMFERDGEYWVRITGRLPDFSGDQITPDPDGIEIRMSLVTGSHHMQVFWMPTFYGNMQIGFPFTWLIQDQKWVPRESVFIRDPHAISRPEVWNLSCIRCHVTDGVPGYDSESDITKSTSADLGISCEACHGPGEAHIAWQQALENSKSNAGSAPEGDDPIIHPEHMDHVRSTQICGQCHGMKWWDEKENWRQTGFDYRPGDDLTETTPIVQPTKIDELPWLQEIVQKNPNLLRDFFWSDGMMRVSGREYNGLLESACHMEGEMSCISCHSLHDSDPNDMLADGMESNAACTQCHPGFEENITAHTHHGADSEGSRCYNCHMPHTTYSLLSAIRSHEIDSPDVTVSHETGRPNACNLCHTDKPLSWTANQLHKWYGKPIPELEEADQQVSSVLVNLLKGDAGQRALAAWHLGWENSIQISGNEWQPRFLAELLDDPYSAVRYVAHKALQRFPGYEQFDYDFVAMPELRKQAQSKAIQIWDQQHRLRLPQSMSPSLLLDAEGALLQPTYSELYEARDDTPIRLRE